MHRSHETVDQKPIQQSREYVQQVFKEQFISFAHKIIDSIHESDNDSRKGSNPIIKHILLILRGVRKGSLP